MSDGDVALVAKTVDNAINSGGNAKLLVYWLYFVRKTRNKN